MEPPLLEQKLKLKVFLTFNSSNISLIMGSNAHLVIYPTNQNKELNIVYMVRKKLENSEDIKQALNNVIFNENKNLINLFEKAKHLGQFIYLTNHLNLSIKMYFILVMLSTLFHQQWHRELHKQSNLRTKFLI